MTVHRIQFRRAWAGPAGRVDLPLEPGGRPLPERLTRRFHRPTLDPTSERMSLELIEVPGLDRVRLNGSELHLDPEAAIHEIPLDEVLPRGNLLSLEIDPRRAAGSPRWGRIALVIRGR